MPSPGRLLRRESELNGELAIAIVDQEQSPEDGSKIVAVGTPKNCCAATHRFCPKTPSAGGRKSDESRTKMQQLSPAANEIGRMDLRRLVGLLELADLSGFAPLLLDLCLILQPRCNMR